MPETIKLLFIVKSDYGCHNLQTFMNIKGWVSCQMLGEHKMSRAFWTIFYRNVISFAFFPSLVKWLTKTPCEFYELEFKKDCMDRVIEVKRQLREAVKKNNKIISLPQYMNDFHIDTTKKEHKHSKATFDYFLKQKREYDKQPLSKKLMIFLKKSFTFGIK